MEAVFVVVFVTPGDRRKKVINPLTIAVFTSVTSRNMHVSLTHKREPVGRKVVVEGGKVMYGCWQCEKMYSTNQHLKTHTLDAHGEAGAAKQYPCALCSFSTNCRTNYDRHMHKHSGVVHFW